MEDNILIEQIASHIDLEQSRSINDAVCEGLRKAVIMGIIPPGKRINQKNLAEYMHMSRTPIRKGIDTLKEEGLLEEIPNFGVVVKHISVGDAKEIYAIRVAIDVLASTTAMNIMSEEEFQTLDGLLDYTLQKNEEGDVEEVIRMFKKFNESIYEFARMPRLYGILKQLQGYLVHFRDIALYRDDRRAIALQEHFDIVEGMRNKDIDSLRNTIEKHLNSSLSFVIDEIIKYEIEIGLRDE